MRSGWSAICVVVMLAVPACRRRGHVAPEESPATMCTRAHHGQTVSVSGYLVQPYFSVECTDDCFLWVSPSPDAQDGVYARFIAGSGTSQIQPIRSHGELTGSGARRLHDSEFHITAESGKPLGIGDLVRVTGLLLIRRAGDKLDCRMEVARVEPSDGSPPTGSAAAAAPPAGPMVFVDVNPLVTSSKQHRQVAAAAMAAMARAGLAAREVDTEVDGFYFDEPLRRGELDGAVPAWWPDSLASDWKAGVAVCKGVAAGGDPGRDAVRECSDGLHYALWERWLTDQHAARYVWIAVVPGDGEGHKGRAFGEAFAVGVAGKRTLWIEAPDPTKLVALAGDVAVRLARDEGTVEDRLPPELPRGR
jgi:hypothetical protein